ncbi:MAG: A/G-specific adenine glycosylase [Armatimonadetes bacterium]|nr:A/G-specific adenine glycosylase [Armatimonadota bacterium]
MVSALLDWYRAEARDLPWRHTVDPYAIWVSEIMLQQTQVATVIDYYHRFLAAFPTVSALAAAPLDDVLSVWQGLGYYRRARSLHAAARAVVERGGALPDDRDSWLALPGIGDYTAGAIASIAQGERVPAVDGNVERVLSRLLALPGDPRDGEPRRVLRAHAAALVPAQAPGEWNQALMELGARVCLPAPDCAACPLQVHCRARAAGEATRYPERRPAKAPRDRLHVVAIIERDGRLLLGRRPAEGRWGGLWELPRVELPPEADAAAGLAAGLAESLGADVTVGAELARLRHAVSGERIVLVGHAATLVGQPRELAYEALLWSSPAALAMPLWQRRLLALARP